MQHTAQGGSPVLSLTIESRGNTPKGWYIRQPHGELCFFDGWTLYVFAWPGLTQEPIESERDGKEHVLAPIDQPFHINVDILNATPSTPHPHGLHPLPPAPNGKARGDTGSMDP